jgi:polyphosphate kinase
MNRTIKAPRKVAANAAAKTAAAPRPVTPADYLNRELSLLAFNRRVYAQAIDPAVPVLERLRYLCIVSSNLDEFFEIRVAGLKEQVRANAPVTSSDGRRADEVFIRVAEEAHALVNDQYETLNRDLFPLLEKQGIRFLRRANWNDAVCDWAREYFQREVMPVVTPIGLDPSHPFPRVLNKSLNFAVELDGRDAFGRASRAAIVQAPRVLPRVIRIPKAISGVEYDFVFLSSIMHAFVGDLFAGMEVKGCYQFRVTRNSDLFVDEEEVKNLRTKLQGELPQRHFGDAVRLEVAENCSLPMTEFLLSQFGLDLADLYRVNGPVNLVRLMQIPDQVDRPKLKFAPFLAGIPKQFDKPGRDVFTTILKGDVLLHHPYQSFTPVINLLQTAATDPTVVAIKMTVYRTGTDSVLMETLIKAAQAGKEVTVVVELMARFDEEANIGWATRLEEVGAHVVYGVVGYKTHAKALMIVRREEDAKGKKLLRRYVHLGTGNYHPRTARLYTDYGLLTCNPEIGEDVNEVFKQLTGLGRAQALHHVWQAPFTLHANVVAAIEREARHAQAGKPAHIIAKMNSLLEPGTVAALYAASQAGVKIDLIVRGACSLRPGVPGLSDNIRVRSIIGRFLEHHRIFYFLDGGKKQVYLSSADWMERNFFRRIELCFPVLEPKLKQRVINEGLKCSLADNTQAWEMDSEGRYTRKRSRGTAHCAQIELMAELGSSGR